jgi:hypothetical protein
MDIPLWIDYWAEFIREYHITQVIFGRPVRAGWRWFPYLSSIHGLLRDTPTVDVHTVTQKPIADSRLRIVGIDDAALVTESDHPLPAMCELGRRCRVPERGIQRRGYGTFYDMGLGDTDLLL